MKIYKVNHNYYIKQRNILLITCVFLGIFLSVIGKYMIWLKKIKQDYSTETIIILISTLLFIFIFTVITQYIKLKKTCASFQIEISDDYIKITKNLLLKSGIFRNNLFVNIIKFSEIDSIKEVINNGILIKSTKNSYISIPVDLDGYDDLKDNLQKIKQITTSNKKQLSPIINVIIVITVFLAFGIAFSSRMPLIVLPLSIALIVLLIWFLIQIFKNSTVKMKFKINSLIFSLIPILLLLFKIYCTIKYFI